MPDFSNAFTREVLEKLGEFIYNDEEFEEDLS
jgi:hypothetical protein